MCLLDDINLILPLIAFTLSLFTAVCNGGGCVDLRVSYVRLSDCIGKSSTHYRIATFTDVALLECALKCEDISGCLTFFHNVKTGICTLHSLTVPDLTLSNDADSYCYVPDDFTQSWIVEILYATYRQSGFEPERMIGTTSNSGHWHTSGNGDAFEFRIASEMYVTRINIFELEGASGVNGIYLKTPTGNWHSVWSTGTLGTVSGRRTLSPTLQETNFKTSQIRITIGLKSQGIYAVKVIGKTRQPMI